MTSISLLLPWLSLRVLLPLGTGATVAYFTWGKPYFDVFTPLLWATFVVHLLVTIAASRTHILDTGSFFCLLFCWSAIADISEAFGNRGWREWGTAATAFAIYALVSLVGRYRATRGDASSIVPVSVSQVVVAVVLLVLAVVVCSTSKTAVGFLLVVPGIGVPAILIYSLFRGAHERDGRRQEPPQSDSII